MTYSTTVDWARAKAPLDEGSTPGAGKPGFPEPRPRRRDERVIALVAAKLAERVAEEWQFGQVSEAILRTALGSSDLDGYALARELERDLVHPDADLVEILDEADGLMLEAHKSLVAEWVKTHGVTSPFAQGDRVICKFGPGEVTRIHEETAQIVVVPDAEKHLFVEGGGYLLAFESCQKEEMAPVDLPGPNQ